MRSPRSKQIETNPTVREAVAEQRGVGVGGGDGGGRMVHIKEPLLLIGKSSPCTFPLTE